MKKKKMHLRDWLVWELRKDLRTLCGISALEDSEIKRVKDAKEEESALKNVNREDVCSTCLHSYESPISHLKKAIKYKKERKKLYEGHICAR